MVAVDVRRDEARRVLELAETAGAVRINVGAGRHVLPGWINVDVAVSQRAAKPPEILCDARELAQLLPERCADEVMAIHLLEHFYRWDVPRVLAGWFGLLKPGGRLVLELPNLLKCAANVLAGTPDNLSMFGLYGDPGEKDEWMTHRWGWTPKTLRTELQAAGFIKIAEETTQWHSGGRKNRDMRIVARRPER